MSGEIEIRGGGAVAVDTDTLHHAASRFLAFEGRLDELRRRLSDVQAVLFEHHRYAADAYADAAAGFQGLTGAVDEAERIATALRQAAAVYELVELNALHRAAWLAGEHETALRLDARRDVLLATYPDISDPARLAEFERMIMWPSELVRQGTLIGFSGGSDISEKGGVIGGAAVGVAAILFGALTGLTGSGLRGRDARLIPIGAPVAITPTRPPAGGKTAPTSLAAVAARIPSGGDARVRVEKYVMRDGSQQFVVYVAGTHPDGGRTEVWDNASNVSLYTGDESASYVATTQALEAAGAEPGDVVHAVGFSQGAMIASHIALESEYDTRTLVTFGSPVEADVGTQTLSVGIRHTDDPVAALAGGGHIGSVGSAGSVVVERSFDPDAGQQDAGFPAHRLTAYTETAALADASGDPRIAGVQSVFDDLRAAERVVVTEYSATRLDNPPVAPAPGRPPV